MSDGLPRAAQFSQTEPIANLAGDLSGDNTAAVVAKLRGYAIGTGAPSSDGDVLQWNSSASEYQPGQLDPAVGGDLSGTIASATVVAIRGGGVTTDARADGNLMEWDDGGSEWGYVSPGGDLSGKIGAATVTGLQGRDVANTAPTDGQALVWSAGNSRWQPGAGGGGASSWNALYAASKTMTIDGAVLQWEQDIATGSGFRVFRDQATSDAPLMVVEAVNAADAQAALKVSGLLALNAVGKVTQSMTDSGTATFDAYKLSYQPGALAAATWAYGMAVEADGSNLTEADSAVFGYRATATSLGSGVGVGYYADDTWTLGMYLKSALNIESSASNPAFQASHTGDVKAGVFSSGGLATGTQPVLSVSGQNTVATHTGKTFEILTVSAEGQANGGANDDYDFIGVNFGYTEAGSVTALTKAMYVQNSWDWSLWAYAPSFWSLTGTTPFAEYAGNPQAGSGGNISTDNGATADMLRVVVGGSTRWIPAYSATALAGSISSWDGMYAADPNSNVLTVSGASDPFEINQTSNSGNAFYVHRSKASGSETAPIAWFKQLNNGTHTEYVVKVEADDGFNEIPLFQCKGQYGNGYLQVSTHGKVEIQQASGRYLDLTGYSRLRCAQIDYNSAAGHSVKIQGNGQALEVGADTAASTKITGTLLDVNVRTDITASTSGGTPALYVRQDSTGDILQLMDGTTERWACAPDGAVDMSANSANPGLTADQEGAGDIFDARLSGTSKFAVKNNGRITQQVTGITTTTEVLRTEGQSGNLGSGQGLVGHKVSLAGATDDATSQIYGVFVELTGGSAATTKRGFYADSSWEYGLYTLSPGYVKQSSATGAVVALTVDQADNDVSFMDFIGSTAADKTNNISSGVGTPDGNAPASGTWTLWRMLKIDLGGTAGWLAVWQ